MNRIYIGIDPGVTGAFAAIHSNGGLLIRDLPVLAETNKSRKTMRVNGRAFHETMKRFLPAKDSLHEIVVILEHTHAMKDSAMTAWSMADSRARIMTALEILNIPVVEVMPSAWKKHFGLLKCDKDVSRTMAIQRFPAMEHLLRLKKHHNRAEALWIALYGKDKGL